jgi:hypothetical protein
MDPLRRIQGWQRVAETVELQRQKLSAEGKPAFVICDHYGLTSLITFYSPDARQAIHEQPLVYPIFLPYPENQYYFWPQYRYRESRRGQNAILVCEQDEPGPPPPEAAADFESVTDLGIFPLEYGGRVTRRIQLFECRNLRADSAPKPGP